MLELLVCWMGSDWAVRLPGPRSFHGHRPADVGGCASHNNIDTREQHRLWPPAHVSSEMNAGVFNAAGDGWMRQSHHLMYRLSLVDRSETTSLGPMP